MNIFHKVALQGLLKNRTRTLVTIVGVVLSAALITAVTTFGTSLMSYMANGAALKSGSWHVAFPDADASFIREQADDSRVKNISTFENIGYAPLEGGQNSEKPYLFIAGFDQETFDDLPLELVSGRLPENSGEILVPFHVVSNGGIKFSVGDTLTLSVGTRQTESGTLCQHDPYSYEEETLTRQTEKTYTVVGTCRRPSFEEEYAPGYTFITVADSADNAKSCSAFVTLKNPFLLHSYESSARRAYYQNDSLLRFMGLSGDKLFTTLLLSVGIIVIAIIMVGSVFLIYNAFNISLNERTHQFGILMSVGATDKQLRNSVIFEGICIGAIGIPIGIVVGLSSMGIVLHAVSQNFSSMLYDNVPLRLVISIPAIAAAALISLITILISTYIPARKAARTPVMECIRQTNEIKVTKKAVKTSPFTERISGLEGMLALKNFKRNKRRYRSIILSLALRVILFIATNAFVVDLQQASKMAVVFTTFDIALDAHEMDDSEMLTLYDDLKNADGVTESAYQACMTYRMTADKSELSERLMRTLDVDSSGNAVNLSMELIFLDDESYLKLVREAGLPKEEYTGQNAKLISKAKFSENDDEEYVNFFRHANVTITPQSDNVSLSEHRRNIDLTFVDIVMPDSVPNINQTQYESTPYYFVTAAPYSLKDSFGIADTDLSSKGLTFNSDTPSRSVEEMEAIISTDNITSGYYLWNVSNMLDVSNNIIFIANVFAYTFVIMISLIAVANVFNTISTNIKMRKRELAMLRSVGMSEQDFQKMMNFECAFYGIRSLLFGLPISMILSWMIYRGMLAAGAEDISFVLPWGSIGVSVFGVLFIVFITMLYSVSKIKKENIIDALRNNMA